MGMESRREINFPILLVNTNKQARLRVDLKGYCGFVSYVLFVAFGGLCSWLRVMTFWPVGLSVIHLPQSWGFEDGVLDLGVARACV